MMNQVYRTLPDDRPITAICIVEDTDKCPNGFIVVSRTHDQDADADLWRDSGFFGKKCTRYLCLSKTEGTVDHVVESILIINEKDSPPKGYTTLNLTSDTAQRAWRKKQLCFKYTPISTTTTAVTDIIVLSRMKKAPEEFLLSGDINGMTLCYKMGKNPVRNGMLLNSNSSMPYSLNPGNLRDQDNSPSSKSNQCYPNIIPNNIDSGIQNIKAIQSKADRLTLHRPAPKPPVATYATISGYGGLEGVPFILNPKWHFTGDNGKTSLPKPKTRTEIDFEYSYEFRTERET